MLSQQQSSKSTLAQQIWTTLGQLWLNLVMMYLGRNRLSDYGIFIFSGGLH